MGQHPTPSRVPDLEQAVRDRYAAAAARPEASLCCATDYDAALLRILPEEIVAKDYGCGDPSRYVREGETVVDLGSGAGKTCYILSQKVGPGGQVIGVDMNDAMLALARRYQREVAERIGHANVRFVKARIQDMALDLERFDAWLSAHPVTGIDDLERAEQERQRMRREAPVVADGVADVVVSNCVLNLVRPEDKARLLDDMFRVLRVGGRAVISDIVCDETPPAAIRNDPELWSGCIAGAFREDEFVEAFVDAGFHGVEILERGAEPWQVVEGIEFRSVTLRAFKAEDGPSLERNHAVVYRGPWRAVEDDDGHRFPRGVRIAVCDKTYRIMTDPLGPYAGDLVPVPPRVEVPIEDARPFDGSGTVVRDPRVTKRQDDRATRRVDDVGGRGTCC